MVYHRRGGILQQGDRSAADGLRGVGSARRAVRESGSSNPFGSSAPPLARKNSGGYERLRGSRRHLPAVGGSAQAKETLDEHGRSALADGESGRLRPPL